MAGPSSHRDPDTQRRVQALADEFLTRRAEGDTVSPEDFCRTHADLADELRSVIATFVPDASTGSHDAFPGDVTAAPDAPAASPHALPGDATVAPAPGATAMTGLDLMASDDSIPADAIPGYTIVAKISAGGQGVVLQALQKSTKRKVALKVLREGQFATPREKVRFEREIDVLASLKHRNIVNILDSGIAGGRHYYAMEYVAGKPLDQYVTDGLSIEDRVRLFLKVCDAVHFAQLNSVVHRDLKPNNILIDAEGEPKILDFGLAKRAGREAIGETSPEMVTISGQFMGSLPWASPEQVTGESDLIDMRTDVYSLGVILYQMLTARFPYEVRGPMHVVQSNIMNAVPVRPRTVHRRIDSDVETIVLKALEKSRDDRYQSVGELAADVKRYLEGSPIVARPPSLVYLLRKRMVKHKVQTAVAAMVSIIIIAFTFSATYLAIDSFDARDQAEAFEKQLGAQGKEFLDLERRGAGHEAAVRVATKGRDRAVRLSQRMAEALRDAGLPLHRAESTMAAEEVLWSLYRPGRGLAHHYLIGRTRLPSGAWTTLLGRVGSGMPALAIAAAPNGRQLATANMDHTITIWSLATGLPERIIAVHERPVMGLAYSPDGKFLVSHDDRGHLVAIDPKTGTVKQRFGEDDAAAGGRRESVVALAVSRQFIAAGDGAGMIVLWDPDNGARVRELRGHIRPVAGLAFSPVNGQLVSGSSDGDMKQWDPFQDTPVKTWRLEAGGVASLALSRDGRRLATGHRSGIVILWDVETGAELGRHGRHTGTVLDVHFSPDGRQLAAASFDTTISIWTVDTSLDDPAVHLLVGHDTPIGAVAWVPGQEGTRLASVGNDGVVRVWDADAPKELQQIRSPVFWTPVALPDPASTEATSTENAWAFWDLDATSGQRFDVTGRVLNMAFSPDSNRLAVATDLGVVSIWDRTDATEVATIRDENAKSLSVAFESNGSWLAVGREDQSIAIYNLDKQDPGRRPDAVYGDQAGAVHALAVAPDGKTLAAGGGGAFRIALYTLGANGRLSESPRDLSGHANTVRCLAYSGDGAVLASGDDDGVIRRWNPETGEPSAPLTGHQSAVRRMIVLDDGQTLVSQGAADEIFVWDLMAGTQLAQYSARTLPRMIGRVAPNRRVIAVVRPTPPSGLNKRTIDLIPLAIPDAATNP